MPATTKMRTSLNVVDVDLLAGGASLLTALRVTVFVELESAVAVLAATVGVGLVDLGGFGKLSVGLEGTRLVGGVLKAIVRKRDVSLERQTSGLVRRVRGATRT